MIEFPKSIKEIDLSALKPDAEAIKYLFTNLENGMKYVSSQILIGKVLETLSLMIYFTQ